MPKKTDYRIIQIQKKGYYNYYRVQVKTLWFFWVDASRAFDHISTARRWIDDQLVVQTQAVVE